MTISVLRMMDSLLKSPSTVMQLAYLGITELEIRQDSNKDHTNIFTSTILVKVPYLFSPLSAWLL
jgi:hypothetical protein